MLSPHHAAVYAICTLSLGGVLVRPWRTNEAGGAIAGMLALLAARLISWQQAFGAVLKGADVYMFLVGMMLLSELARREGLFDWLPPPPPPPPSRRPRPSPPPS